VRSKFFHKQAGGGALADEPTLHVGEGDDHGVDALRGDEVREFFEGEISGPGVRVKDGHGAFSEVIGVVSDHYTTAHRRQRQHL
jgi:hypothetical protein